MALTDSFPGPNGVTDSIEAGKDLAALVAHVGGVPRAGITWGTTPLVTSRTDLRVDIAPFKAVLVRSGAVRLLANDTTDQSPELTVPTANSRIDVLYVKVGESAIVGGETDGPFFGIIEGVPNAIPSKPVLSIDGALELATIQIPSGATTTSSGGVIITQTAPLTGAHTLPVDTRGTVTPTLGSGWAAPTTNSLKRENGWAQYLFNGPRNGGTAIGAGGIIASIPAGYRARTANVWGFAWGLGGAINPVQAYYDIATDTVKVNQAVGGGQSIALSLMWRVEA